MKKLLFILLGCFLFIGTMRAQDGKIRSQLESMRIAHLTKQLDLTKEEAATFWPVYNEYLKERNTLRKSMRQQTPKGAVSEAEAEALIEGSFAKDEKELSLKKKYYKQLKDILPASKLAKLPAAERAFKKEILKAVKTKRGSK